MHEWLGGVTCNLSKSVTQDHPKLVSRDAQLNWLALYFKVNSSISASVISAKLVRKVKRSQPDPIKSWQKEQVILVKPSPDPEESFGKQLIPNKLAGRAVVNRG